MTRADAERVLDELGVEYRFVDLAQSESIVPGFAWSSPHPTGRYRGLIREVGVWRLLYEEHLLVEVEIDDSDAVAQVVVETRYTGP